MTFNWLFFIDLLFVWNHWIVTGSEDNADDKKRQMLLIPGGSAPHGGRVSYQPVNQVTTSKPHPVCHPYLFAGSQPGSDHLSSEAHPYVCHPLTQSDLAYIGKNLIIKVTVVDNLEFDGHKHKIRIDMHNNGNQTIWPNYWSIYFYSFFMIESDHLPSKTGYRLDKYCLELHHEKGDRFRITASGLCNFTEIKSGESRTIEFFGQYWAVSKSDILPNWYVAGYGLRAELLQSTRSGMNFVTDFTSPKQWKRYKNDLYNPYNANERYQKYDVQNVTYNPVQIIPTPVFVKVNERKYVNVSALTHIESYGIPIEDSRYLSEKLKMKLRILSRDSPCNGSLCTRCIQLCLEKSLLQSHEESYNLHVNGSEETIRITGMSSNGVFYGMQSLLSLLSGEADTILPEIDIQDQPRYSYRGLFIDVARHFVDKNDIIKTMNVMAMYKMNRLHLHLSDDEGWRLEIPGIPELTQIGSKRCHDDLETVCLPPSLGSGPDTSTTGSGYYTVEDYKEIIKEASKLHIEVIPEMDMPGHARAAVTAMEKRFKNYEHKNYTEASMYRLKDPMDTSKYMSVQMYTDNAINPCLHSTYTFIEKVVSEVKKMHSGLKVFHFGGDEVPSGAWINSRRCRYIDPSDPIKDQNELSLYFVKRVSEIVQAKGLGLSAWENGFLSHGDLRPYPKDLFKNSRLTANAWNNVWEWGGSKRAYDLANNGYQVIMSQGTHLYLDSPYEPDPDERGLYWASRFTDTQKTFGFMPDSLYENIDVRRSGEPITKADVCGDNNTDCPKLRKPENIIGIQGQLWTETVLNSENLDYMLYPRLLALAERAWHKAKWETADEMSRDYEMKEDWKSFAVTLSKKEISRLESLNISYRIPLPGAIVEDGFAKVNSEFPGFMIEYSINGDSWNETTTKFLVKENSTYILRSRSLDGMRKSRTVVLET